MARVLFHDTSRLWHLGHSVAFQSDTPTDSLSVECSTVSLLVYGTMSWCVYTVILVWLVHSQTPMQLRRKL